MEGTWFRLLKELLGMTKILWNRWIASKNIQLPIQWMIQDLEFFRFQWAQQDTDIYRQRKGKWTWWTFLLGLRNEDSWQLSDCLLRYPSQMMNIKIAIFMKMYGKNGYHWPSFLNCLLGSSALTSVVRISGFDWRMELTFWLFWAASSGEWLDLLLLQRYMK